MTSYRAVDLDTALARLAAEVEPNPALKARVLADAAMVSAERRPAVALRPRRAARGGFGWLTGWTGLSVGGALATAALALALGFGGGLDLLGGGQGDQLTESDLAALEGIEREVLATLDDDFFDAPL